MRYCKKTLPEELDKDSEQLDCFAWLHERKVRLSFLLLAGCCVILFLATPVLRELWQIWAMREDFKGLYFVPILLGPIIFRRKEDFFRLYPRFFMPAIMMVPLMLGAMVKASWAHEIRIAGILFVGSIGLYVWGIFGRESWRVLVGPFLFLLLMVPLNDSFMDFVISRLQGTLSFVLDNLYAIFSDSYIARDGFKLLFFDRWVGIAPECSGIRSLYGLLIGAFFFGLCDRLGSLKISIMLLIASVISFIINLFRIIITIELRLHGYEWLTEGAWHGLLGMAAFIAGFVILSKLSRAFKRFWVREQEISGC